MPALKNSTIQTYLRFFELSWSRAYDQRSSNIDDPAIVRPGDLVDDWIARRYTNRPRTENLQRAALLWVFQNKKIFGWEAACARLQAISQESVRSRRAALDVSGQNHVRVKGKVIPPEDLQLLINQLRSMGTWGARAQYFLLAGVASGARPIEWLKTVWVDEEHSTIRIGTAKIKNRNAWDSIEPMKYLDFSNSIEPQKENPLTSESICRDVFIEPQYRRYVDLHMTSTKLILQEARTDSVNDRISDEDLYKVKYFDKIRHCIWRACRGAFPGDPKKRYSLSDMRQTFSANRKAQNGLWSTAIELGHTGVTSTKDHYAPASKAWSRYKPKPGETSRLVPTRNLISAPAEDKSEAMPRG